MPHKPWHLHLPNPFEDIEESANELSDWVTDRFFNFENTNVVILGQDPYINENQAMGLSFSVPEGVKLPPSLKNIYKCI